MSYSDQLSLAAITDLPTIPRNLNVIRIDDNGLKGTAHINNKYTIIISNHYQGQYLEWSYVVLIQLGIFY